MKLRGEDLGLETSMAALGSDVQSTSIEIVSVIEDMRDKSSELESYILQEEEEKIQILSEIKALECRLSVIEDSLKRKREAKGSLDKVLAQTYQAFQSIVDNSRQLLSSAKEESSFLRKKCDVSI